MLQRVELCFLEIVRPVDRVEPHIEEVLCPLAISDGEAAGRKAVFVLCKYKVYPVALEVAECLNNAVRGDYRRIREHCSLKLRGSEERRMDRKRGIHDERGVVDVPEPRRAWVEGHGMAHGRHAGPGDG